ncbi:MAG: hypothetical protein JEZ11_10290 [Desulfobacterales bacterium]|nr:hypothetical protein [Desulfobacterales bacterium]
MEKIKVGVIGATGMVGQNYIALLSTHPWFDMSYVAASPGSADKPYEDSKLYGAGLCPDQSRLQR